jgi:transposase-like protein
MAEGKRLTAAEFTAAIDRLSIAERPTAMARAVLVDGRMQSEVARTEGVSRNAVFLAVTRIWEAHSGVPEGFERVTVVLPKHKVAIVRQWQDSAVHEMESTR